MFKRNYSTGLICLVACLFLTLLFAACSQTGHADTSAAQADPGLTLDRLYINITYGSTTTVTASYELTPEYALAFSADDSSIVSVKQCGDVCELTATDFGETTLTASYGSHTVSVPVKVSLNESKLNVVHQESQGIGDASFPAILNQPLNLKGSVAKCKFCGRPFLCLSGAFWGRYCHEYGGFFWI